MGVDIENTLVIEPEPPPVSGWDVMMVDGESISGVDVSAGWAVC